MATKRGPDKYIGLKLSIYLGHLPPPSLSPISCQDHPLPAHETSGPRAYPSILVGLFWSIRQIHANKQGYQGLICGERKGKGCISNAAPRIYCHFQWQKCDWMFSVWGEHNGELFSQLVCEGQVSPYFQQGEQSERKAVSAIWRPLPKLQDVPRSYG